MRPSPLLSRFLLLCSVALAGGSTAQFDGYVLHGNLNSTTARLLDENGTIAKQWNMSGSNAYAMALKDNGNLVRSVVNNGNQLNGAAVAGKVQEVDPSNNVVWEFVYSTSTYVTHHDLCLMPNGNVLLIAWYNPGNAALQALGYTGNQNKYPTRIIEVQQNGTGGQVVWEWNMLDHFIQDVDPNKPNYVVISDHPERMDINVPVSSLGGPGGGGDWFHVNGIDYNPDLDQIAFSSRLLSEIFIIDHSTTTAEAATSSGGNSGMGGDFLYRWGNPDNYDTPGTQVIPAAVHDVRWIKPGRPNAGYLQFVNNSALGNTGTTIDAIDPPLNGYTYTRTPGQAFTPSTYDWRHVALTGNSGQSASDRMPDGNTFVAISNGYMYEVDTNGNVVWQYADGPQKAFRYTCDDPGIIALLGADPCGLNTGVEGSTGTAIGLSPNPTTGSLVLGGLSLSSIRAITVMDASGRIVSRPAPQRTIDLGTHQNGWYLVEVELTDGRHLFERVVLTR